MTRIDAKMRFCGFAGRGAFMRRFDAVIDGIRHQMRYRCFQPIKNIAIDACALSGDFQFD